MVTLVLGAGKMGRAICHAMVRLGSTVIVVDKYYDMIAEARAFCDNKITGEVIDDNLSDLQAGMEEEGLPAEDTGDNPLNYKITWSVDGLINEYRDDCIALKGGKPVVVKGMDGLESINIECAGDDIQFEKFYTSGGASHTIDSMMARGAKNCSYKTIRYAGHCNIVKYLIFDCGLGDEELQKIFESCGVASKDVVLMTAKVKGDDVTWYKENAIFSDEKFSAMQKCTAYPISAVAYLMATGHFNKTKQQHRDWNQPYPKVLSYSDVPYKEFLETLHELGLDV